jgi:hypothetical protein
LECNKAAVYSQLLQIYRLSDAGGVKLENIFERYPFLGDYFNEMRSHMPDEITWEEGTRWWREQVELWEGDCTIHLPLKALAQQAGLDYASRMAFMLVGLVEEDSRFGTLFAELQEPLAHRRPTLELVGQMMMDETAVGEVDPWSICKPLLDLGVIEAPNKTAARSEWALRVPPLLWDAARGKADAVPGAHSTITTVDELATLDELVVDDTLRQKIYKIPQLIESKIARSIVIRAILGSNSKDVLAAIARARSLGVVFIDHEAMDEDFIRVIGPLCIMTNSMPVFTYDLGPGEVVSVPKMPGYTGPVGVIMGMEGGLHNDTVDKVVTIGLSSPGIELRKLHWRAGLKGNAVEDLDKIAERFRLPGGYIRQTAEMAIAHAGLRGHESISVDDVREAGRTLNRQLLDSLASHLEAKGDWSHLIAGESTLQRLQELYRRCRNREKLMNHLGPGFGTNSNCGVRALLTGASGTGKTLAAKIIAAELGMDLYRVDLAAIVNKYIGETEKNLHRILSRAEALDVVLLLDEGDALLGSRTDVKSANDRYANLETNYLLQRLEHYQGIVLITTNLVQNIDRAFQRRMDILVPFFSPQPEERLQILLLHLPVDHKVEFKLLEMAAAQCALSGGQLRNVALHATLAALEAGVPVNWSHLEEGLRSEYRKAGGTFPLDGKLQKPNREVDMQLFVGALSGR